MAYRTPIKETGMVEPSIPASTDENWEEEGGSFYDSDKRRAPNELTIPLNLRFDLLTTVVMY